MSRRGRKKRKQQAQLSQRVEKPKATPDEATEEFGNGLLEDPRHCRADARLIAAHVSMGGVISEPRALQLLEKLFELAEQSKSMRDYGTFTRSLTSILKSHRDEQLHRSKLVAERPRVQNVGSSEVSSQHQHIHFHQGSDAPSDETRQRLDSLTERLTAPNVVAGLVRQEPDGGDTSPVVGADS